jgi:prophage regulatory protein
MIQNDILDRLRTDPGQRTIGQLLQDREAAVHEIRKLLAEIERLRTVRAGKKPDEDTRSKPATEQGFHPKALIRIGEVCELVGVSRSTIYHWVSEGTFPAPVRISKHSVRWKVDEIEGWRESL